MRGVKNRLIVLCCFLGLAAAGNAAEYAADVELAPGFCRPLIDSKIYLKNGFSDGYPREIAFTCQYECRAENEIRTFVGTIALTLRDTSDDAIHAVCQGVLVKKVSWGWDFAGVTPFYGRAAIAPDLKQVAMAELPVNGAEEYRLRLALAKTLEDVSKTFLMAHDSRFEEAGRQLAQIAKDLPGESPVLNRYLAELSQNHFVLPNQISAKSLVLMMLRTHAFWLIGN